MADNSEDDVAGVIMLPPLILLIAIAIMVALEFLVPFTALPAVGLTNWISWLGAVLIAAGVAIAVVGRAEFEKAGTNVNVHKPALKLVTSGPYLFTRNPMYLGMLLLVAGLTLAFSMEWGLIVWPIFLAVLHFGVIRREEHYLTRKFGAPYEEFLKRTRRYV